MDIKDYRALCIKSVTENTNKYEEEILYRWLAESEDNKKELARIKEIWAGTVPNTVAQIPDIDEEWNALQRRIENAREDKSAKDSILSKFYSILSRRWKPIAGLTLTIILLVVCLSTFRKETNSVALKTVITHNREHKLVQLADGSTVLLNDNSSLSYNEVFDGDSREVTLSGEAFFSVTKNTRPFIITTSNAKTTVLGTKFDVWSRDEKTRVFVKEGRVNLAGKKQNDFGVLLTKNHVSVINNNMVPEKPRQVEPTYMLSWIENKLVFNQTPLYEISDELKQFYNINISLEDENLKNYTLTGSFSNNSIDSVLTMICLALDLKYEKFNNGYVIKSGQIKK
jgi:transmembrane sensor